ncbi:MAG: hypothetical protein KTR25_20375, partial [Myxococcales bacterium]|nr:hypothetical protein [Myxococcales bacterium]
DPTGLNTNEYDGYFVIESSTETLSVPWYMLPRKSSNLTRSRALRFSADGTARTKIVNKGMGIATNEAFTLLALSERLPPPSGPEDPTIDLKAVGVRTSPVPAAVCGPTNSFVIEVAFHLWETSALPIPLIQQVNIDLTGDGVTDYRLFNGDFLLLDPLTPGIDGRNVSLVADPDSFLSAFFFVENATNTKNTVLTACAEQLGLTSADFGTKEVSMAFETYSAFFDPADAEPRDRIEPVKFVLGAERYTAEVEDVEPYEVGYLEVTDHGTEGPNLGILLLTNSDRGEENRGGATPETEALIFSPSREVLSWANKN